jgi:PHD/YefM family antitoxin component YafN of YafNO toxin-antitoxin module
MSPTLKLHPRYVVGRNGKREAIILPLAEYDELIEDLADLAVAAERRDEKAVPHDLVVAELKRDGLLPH